MQQNTAHRELAARLILQHKDKDFVPPDSLVALTAYSFTEEEATVVNKIGYAPRNARTIAKRVRRPLDEVRPILESLADRVLIGALPVMNVMHYSMLPLVPGVFEAQVLVNRDKNTEYIRQFSILFEEFYKELGEIVRPVLDGKNVPVFRIIPVEKTITRQQDLNVIAFSTDRYSEMVDRNNSFALLDCPCRTTSELVGDPCDKPKDVCAGMGFVADMVIHKGMARRVSKEEFLDAKARANEAGLVNAVDNLKDPLQVCSCCACCCVGLRLANLYNIPALIAKSHFESSVDSEMCDGCGACQKWCPMNALTTKDDTCEVDYTRCIGCGVCAGKCKKGALFLKARTEYEPPPDDVVSHAIGRFMDFKGYNKKAVLPRATLGFGRVLGKYVQPKLSGPKYRPKKSWFV